MISIESAAASIAAMEAMIPFFPRDPNAQDYLLAALRRFVGTEDELRWLTDTAINSIRKWEGLPQLRGLFCSHFRPADGVEMDCDVAGYTPADCERAYLERQSAETQRLLAEYKQQLRIEGATCDPALLVSIADRAVKRLPAVQTHAKGQSSQ